MKILLFVLSFALSSSVFGACACEGVPKAFPGALGYAADTPGGRGGAVVIVDSLGNAVADDGVTTLREALAHMSGPRTIVFGVGGVVDIGDTKIKMQGEADSFVTVAFQSAPPPGITVKGPGINIQDGAHDIIFRHYRIRATDVPGLANAGRGLTIASGAHNIMIDHASLSWATDENFQVYVAPDQTEDITNVTLSNSIIAEGDADSSHTESVEHPEWFYHAMGPSCLSNSTDAKPVGCSIVNNFIAHNSSRNGMIWGGSGEISNNIVYNWYSVGITLLSSVGGVDFNDVDGNVHNNYLRRGPNTIENDDPLYLGASQHGKTSRYSASGNYLDGEPLVIDQAGSAFPPATGSPVPITELVSPGGSYLSCIGASVPRRDATDERVIAEFHAGTGRIGIRDDGERVYDPKTGRWPDDYDADKDGMADEWEARTGLHDPLADHDRDGYTNIEEFLNELAQCAGDSL